MQIYTAYAIGFALALTPVMSLSASAGIITCRRCAAHREPTPTRGPKLPPASIGRQPATSRTANGVMPIAPRMPGNE